MAKKITILCVFIISFLLSAVTVDTGIASPGLTAYVDPPLVEDLSAGATFDVYVKAREAVDLWMVEIEMDFNPSALNVVDDPGIAGIEGINLGDTAPYMEFMYFENLDNATGWLKFVTGRPLGIKTGLSGTVQLAKITFKVMADYGNSALHLHDTTLTVVGPVNVDHETEDGYFKNTFLSDIRGPVGPDYLPDGIVNMWDLDFMALAYGKTSADPDWNEYKIADIRGPVGPSYLPDNVVDIWDLGYCGLEYGKSV